MGKLSSTLVQEHNFSSKKELYLHLCDHPLLINEGKKAISTPTPFPPPPN
jgi:hypothetical protein